MENFWAAVEDIWNSSRVVAWLLAMGGISLAVWASFWPQSPGVSIGLLALAAGIMSVRPKMHPAEKFAWVAVLAVFAILEVIAIGHSDKTNEGIRDQQNAKFDGIAEKLKTNIETSKTQYKDTIDHVDGVLEQTKGVAQIAQENLEDVTGGESFGYVIPSLTERGALIAMMVHNDGKQPLTLQVRVLSLTDTCAEWGKIIKCAEKFDDPYGAKAFDVGVVAGRDSIRAPFSLPARTRRDGTSLYLIQIRGQNGTAREHIWFKPSTAESGTAYRYQIERAVRGKPKKGDEFAEGETMRMLNVVDWTDIPPNPKQP